MVFFLYLIYTLILLSVALVLSARGHLFWACVLFITSMSLSLAYLPERMAG